MLKRTEVGNKKLLFPVITLIQIRIASFLIQVLNIPSRDLSAEWGGEERIPTSPHFPIGMAQTLSHSDLVAH